MEFNIRLILPSQWVPHNQPKPPGFDHTAESTDDDPNRPLFLVRASDLFAANGVRFEISGFFEKPLPVSTDTELVIFLEQLPGLLRFLEDPSVATFLLDLYEQGIQTKFSFLKLDGGELISVKCSSRTNRRQTSSEETLSRRRIVGQMIAFVETYREALHRYASSSMDESWNQDLFAITQRLRAQA